MDRLFVNKIWASQWKLYAETGNAFIPLTP